MKKEERHIKRNVLSQNKESEPPVKLKKKRILGNYQEDIKFKKKNKIFMLMLSFNAGFIVSCTSHSKFWIIMCRKYRHSRQKVAKIREIRAEIREIVDDTTEHEAEIEKCCRAGRLYRDSHTFFFPYRQ